MGWATNKGINKDRYEQIRRDMYEDSEEGGRCLGNLEGRKQESGLPKEEKVANGEEYAEGLSEESKETAEDQ